MATKKTTTKTSKKTTSTAPKGASNGASKLTDAKVSKIRELFKKGDVTKRSLALKYDVSSRTIDQIVRRKTWTHVA